MIFRINIAIFIYGYIIIVKLFITVASVNYKTYDIRMFCKGLCYFSTCMTRIFSKICVVNYAGNFIYYTFIWLMRSSTRHDINIK